MVHIFEFVAGFALAMMAELCWQSVMSPIMWTPPHIMRFFPGSYAGGVKVHLVALVWFMLGIVGAMLFVVRLVAGAWWQAATIGVGAAAWVVYKMVYYRVRDIMREERRAQPEQR